MSNATTHLLDHVVMVLLRDGVSLMLTEVGALLYLVDDAPAVTSATIMAPSMKSKPSLTCWMLWSCSAISLTELRAPPGSTAAICTSLSALGTSRFFLLYEVDMWLIRF